MSEEIKKVKPITLRDNKTNDVYVLEFTRDSVQFAERRGFKLDDVADFPMSKIPEFFYYAFRAHHQNISKAETDKILFEELGGMHEGMLDRLTELYLEPVGTLRNKDNEEEVKNARMTVEL